MAKMISTAAMRNRIIGFSDRWGRESIPDLGFVPNGLGTSTADRVVSSAAEVGHGALESVEAFQTPSEGAERTTGCRRGL